MSKDQLLQEMADAYERIIAAATEASLRNSNLNIDGAWGPREVIAHMAGWEVIGTVQIPKVVAGMSPLEFADVERQTVMDDAINAALITMIGDQSLEIVCIMLRRAYQSTIELLKTLDDSAFQPGHYVYERSQDVIEHCVEHLKQLAGHL